MTLPVISAQQRGAFISEVMALQEKCHAINEDKGFLEEDHIIENLRATGLFKLLDHTRRSEKMALIHDEVSEALRATRTDINAPGDHIGPDYTAYEEELADTVIRIFNLAYDDKLRLAEAIIAKTEFNSTRPHRHGGKNF